jgi:hypothetical protein
VNSHGATDVRTTIGTSGRRSARVLMMAICRTAWPKPWPVT